MHPPLLRAGGSDRNRARKGFCVNSQHWGDWYGDIHIAPTVRSEHFQYDTFIVRWRGRKLLADAYVDLKRVE